MRMVYKIKYQYKENITSYTMPSLTAVHVPFFEYEQKGKI